MSTTKSKSEILDLTLQLASAIARMPEGGTGEGTQAAPKAKTPAPKRATNGRRLQTVLCRMTRKPIPEIVTTIATATGRSKTNARALVAYDGVTLETLVVLADSLGLSVGRLATLLAQELEADPLPGWRQCRKWGLHKADMRV